MKTGPECKLTLVEWDAAVQDDPSAHPEASTFVQRADESAEQLLLRTERTARVLRDSGYWIRSIRLVLGAEDAARHAERVELACRLGHLLTSHSTLHLVTTKCRGPRINWVELVGLLLSDSRWPLHVRLAMDDQGGPCAARSRPPTDWADRDTRVLTASLQPR